MIDLNKYAAFVEQVTSEPSNNYVELDKQMQLFNQDYINISLLLTSGIGLSSETGEFNEIIKKCLFQGKPLNRDTEYHMKRELGDIIWYWINGCRALDVDPNEIIEMNIDKLKSRYPGGEFNAHYSENRKENDL